MAFTREFIRNAAKESGVEIPKELEDALVQEHISARDTYAEGKVKKALEENQTEPVKVKETQEYKDLKKEYDDYRAGQEAKESRAAKESKYRELLKAAGIPEKRIAAVLRVSDLDSVELDDKGEIKGADKLTEDIKTEWADFIPTTRTKSPTVATPPEGGEPAKKAPSSLAQALAERYTNDRKD